AVRRRVDIRERLVRWVAARNVISISQNPAVSGVGARGRDGLPLLGGTVTRRKLLPIPEIAVVAKRELMGKTAVERVGEPDRQCDVEIAVEDIDIVDAREVVQLARLQTSLQCRKLLLRLN